MKLEMVLVPIDFSDSSLKALRYAVAFARQFGGKLIVLSVVEPVANPAFSYFPLAAESDEVIERVKARLDQLCRRQKLMPDLVERSIVRTGNAFQEICEAAGSLKVDLIVIATRGHTGLKHAWLGSTAERVVRHAPCPVLVVREREHEFT